MVTPKPIKLSETDIARFWSKAGRVGPDDCWEWQAARNGSGYGLFADCTYSLYRAHRVAYAVTYGDTVLLVCHTCNNPSCCNPKHLYAGTQGDNMCQCYTEGRGAYGKKCGNTKLTESDICEIRRLYASGQVQHEIARDYGICRSHVSRICRGERWKYV